MRPDGLGGLVRVATAACEAVEVRLARLRREEEELRRQIAALEAARKARAAEAFATDVALRAGVDLRWEGWIDRRAAGLATDLARLLARIEMTRDELALAFGRRIATEALADQARAGTNARRLKADERGW